MQQKHPPYLSPVPGTLQIGPKLFNARFVILSYTTFMPQFPAGIPHMGWVNYKWDLERSRRNVKEKDKPSQYAVSLAT